MRDLFDVFIDNEALICPVDEEFLRNCLVEMTQTHGPEHVKIKLHREVEHPVW